MQITVEKGKNNQKHPKISEICTLLMIYNFPAAFEGYSKENFSYLKQIIENEFIEVGLGGDFFYKANSIRPSKQIGNNRLAFC